MTKARARMLEVVKQYAGCGMSSRSNDFKEVLGEAIPPFDLTHPFKCWQDPSTKAWHTQGVSTCGLFAEGLWRIAGVEVPEDWVPYHPHAEVERAIARAQQFAIRHGAAYNPHPDIRPYPGDYVCIGTGTLTHALTVLDWDGDTMTSVDGGQVDELGLQCSKVCNRKWKISGKDITLGGRKVNFWVDVDFLPWKEEWCG